MLGQSARENQVLQRGHSVLFEHELRTRQDLPKLLRHHPGLGMMRARRGTSAGEDDEVEVLAGDERRDRPHITVQVVIEVVTADDSHRTHVVSLCAIYA